MCFTFVSVRPETSRAIRVGQPPITCCDVQVCASGASNKTYIARAFGDRLGAARAAMEAFAASLPPRN